MEVKKEVNFLTSNIAYSPDGKSVLSGSWDGTVRLWDITSGKLTKEFKEQPEFPPLTEDQTKEMEEFNKKAKETSDDILKKINKGEDFDALAKEKSERNPVYYVQYAYTRIASIEREAASRDLISRAGPYTDDAEWRLIKTLARWPDVVEEVTDSLEVHRLPTYVREVAGDFHDFYTRVRVIDHETIHGQRLVLAMATKIVIGNALRMMGITAPESM